MKNYPLQDCDIQKILNKFGLEKLSSSEEIRGGIINPVYLINGAYVLRIERHTYEHNPDKFKKESILFTILPKYHIPTPQVIGFDDTKEIIDTPYLLLRYIPGANLKSSFASLSKEEQVIISHELGALAKTIHAITPQDLGNESVFGTIKKWVAKSISDFETYWQVVKDTDYISDVAKTVITDTLGQFKKLQWGGIGRLIHGDFIPSNVQIDGGKIVGIVDFEYASIADPLWDLQKLPISFQLGNGFNKEEFLKGCGVGKFTNEEKIRLRMHCFHQGVWELWATKTKFMPLGEKEIEEGKELIYKTLNYKLLH